MVLAVNKGDVMTADGLLSKSMEAVNEMYVEIKRRQSHEVELDRQRQEIEALANKRGEKLGIVKKAVEQLGKDWQMVKNAHFASMSKNGNAYRLDQLIVGMVNDAAMLDDGVGVYPTSEDYEKIKRQYGDYMKRIHRLAELVNVPIGDECLGGIEEAVRKMKEDCEAAVQGLAEATITDNKRYQEMQKLDEKMKALEADVKATVSKLDGATKTINEQREEIERLYKQRDRLEVCVMKMVADGRAMLQREHAVGKGEGEGEGEVERVYKEPSDEPMMGMQDSRGLGDDGDSGRGASGGRIDTVGGMVYALGQNDAYDMKWMYEQIQGNRLMAAAMPGVPRGTVVVRLSVARVLLVGHPDETEKTTAAGWTIVVDNLDDMLPPNVVLMAREDWVQVFQAMADTGG